MQKHKAVLHAKLSVGRLSIYGRMQQDDGFHPSQKLEHHLGKLECCVKGRKLGACVGVGPIDANIASLDL